MCFLNEKSFYFEASHYFHNKNNNIKFQRIHGHSFYCTLTFKSKKLDTKSGWIVDFSHVDAFVENNIKKILDHTIINDIKEISQPSLENIALWIYKKTYSEYPMLYSVKVARPSCHESATYNPFL